MLPVDVIDIYVRVCVVHTWLSWLPERPRARPPRISWRNTLHRHARTKNSAFRDLGSTAGWACDWGRPHARGGIYNRSSLHSAGVCVWVCATVRSSGLYPHARRGVGVGGRGCFWAIRSWNASGTQSDPPWCWALMPVQARSLRNVEYWTQVFQVGNSVL